MNRKCGKCGSSDLQQIEAISNQITQTVDAKSVGVQAFGGQIGASGSKTKATITPLLAKQIKRYVPSKSSLFAFIFYIFIVLFFIAFCISIGVPGSIPEENVNAAMFGYGGLIIFIYLLYKSFQSRRSYEERLKKYKNTWYCWSCGSFRIFK